MRKRHILFSLVTLILFSSYMLLRQNSHPATVKKSSPTITQIPAVTSTSSSCHEQNGLPDPTCTPGSINPSVTQENIASTICVKGYTRTIRPPLSYTENLKKQQMIAYGYTDMRLRDYEEDHLISLELGGNPTDPKNLWPEPGASPNAKDKIENLCREKVCMGQISLLEAQKEIATNWRTACQ